MSTQRSTSMLGASARRQRVGRLLPDVAHITLRVTANGQAMTGSPFPIGLDSGTTSVEITANVDHLFIIKITKHQGDLTFRGEATTNLRARVEMDLPIKLVPHEMQNISALLGGEMVVTDPQSVG